MAEFKIGLGLEIEQEDKVAVQKIIDDIRAEKPEIKIKVNTEQALKNIKDLQKELKKLKDVKINIKTDSSSSRKRNASSSSGVNDFLSTDMNNVSWAKSKTSSSKTGNRAGNRFDYDWYDEKDDLLYAREVNDAYNELMKTLARVATLRSNLEKKKPFSSQKEIDVLNEEINRVEIYGKTLQATYGNDFTDRQKLRINEAKIQGKFKINRANAQVEDKADIEEVNAVYKSLIANIEEVGKAKIKIAKLDAVADADEIANEKARIDQLEAEYNELFQAKRHYLTAEQEIGISNTTNNYKNKLKDVENKVAKSEQKALEKARATEVNNAFKEVQRLQNVISGLDKEIATLDPIKDKLKLESCSRELEKFMSEYLELLNLFEKDFSAEQILAINKQSEELNGKLLITKSGVQDVQRELQEKARIKETNSNFKELDGLANTIDKVREKLAKLDVSENSNEVKVLTNQLDALEKEYQELYSAFSKDLSDEQFEQIWKKAKEATDRLDAINAQALDKQMAQANRITSNFAISQGGNGKFDKEISNITTQMSKLSIVSDEVETDVAQLKMLINEMVDVNAIGDIDKLINKYNEYVSVLDKVKNSLKQAENAQNADVSASKLQDAKQKLSNDIDIWLQKNSASAKDFGAVLDQIKAQIQGADKIKLDSLQREFNQVKQEAQLAGKTGLTFVDTLKKQWEQMKGYFTLYDVYSYAKQGITSMFQEVNKVDTAMSGLYRVTDLTTTQYQEMYNGMTESAKQYGLVLSDLIDGATTWAKLGFSGTQASELGEISGRYQVVADTDAETAVANLVTAYNGFKDELLNLYDGDDIKAVEYISDIFNKLGNEYAIDAESIGVALTKSASALSVAGNDIQQASGMITGIAEKTGNAERGSNALKILSLRLRGMTGELEELGEEVDENVVSISAMQTKVLNLTGGKVNIFKDDGSFKSTYDIMKEISEIYYDLSDVNRASLLETIAGKNRASDVQALIDNWKQVENATESAYNAEGSAMAEYSIHMDTLQASLNELSSAWQEFSNIFLDTDFLKNGIDSLTTLLELLGKLIDNVGVMPIILAGISGYTSVKKNDSIFNALNLASNVKKDINGIALSMNAYNASMKTGDVVTQNFGKGLMQQSQTVANLSTGFGSATKSLIKYASSTKTATIATTAFNAVASFGTSLLISMGISAILNCFNSYNEKLKEAREQTQESLNITKESVQQYKEEANTLNELSSRYEKLKKSGDISPESRAEIAEIQKNIVDLVGAEANELDLVGGKLDDNLKKLEQYKNKLLEKESDSLIHQFNLIKENNKNANVQDDSEKIAPLSEKYDIAGDIGASRKYLKQIGVDYGFNPFVNKVGLDAELNEFNNYEEIESAKEALDYYKKIKKEWIKAYSDDKGVSVGYAEKMLSKTNDVFGKLNTQISKLEVQTKEEKQVIQNYLDNQLISISKYDKDLNDIKVDSADDYQKYVDIFTDKILNDRNIKEGIEQGYFTKEEVKNSVETYISGLDQISAYTRNWQAKYKNIEMQVSFSKDSLNKAKTDLETLYAGITESNSSTGLSSDSINNIKALYSELEGYDASKLFERTSIGIKLNRNELEKLQSQYENQNKSAIHSNLRDLIVEYEDLKERIAKCTDEERKAELQSELASKEDQINEVRNLASEYDSLTSAYHKWEQAQSTPNEGDAYDSYTENLKNLKNLYSKGLIGIDDFQSGVQLMTNEDLTGKTAQEYAQVYKEQLPIVQKFFKEGKNGCENFLKSVEALDKGWAKQNKDGSWEFDFDNDKLAKELGISVDLVELLVDKLVAFGFEVDKDYSLDGINSLKELAKDAVNTLNELNKTELKFNFDSKNIKDANSEIEKAQKLLDTYKNDDGVLDLTVAGASEAQTVLETLIRQRQSLNQPVIMDIKLNKDELETDYGYTVTLLQSLQKYADTLEVKIKTGQDTSDTKTKIQDTINELNKLPEEVKTSIGFNEKDVKKKLSNIAKIKPDVDLKEEDVETIRNTIASVKPEMLAKVDKTEIKKFKKEKIDKKGNVTFDLKKTKELKDFMKSTPTVKGKVEFTSTTPPKNKNSDDDKPAPSRSDKKTGKIGADGTANVKGSAFAKGNWSIKGSGKALVGELGQELVVRDGRYFTVGDNGAEFFDYKPNDIIFNAGQTRELLEQGKIVNGKTRGRAIANGTAFARGKGGKLSDSSNSTSKSSKSSKSSSGSSTDQAKDTFDWIEISIERIENAISDLDKIADSVYYSFSTRNKKLKSEYSEVGKEIKLQQKAYTRYMKEANSVGLSSKYKKLVQKGAIDIDTITNESLRNKIQEYQEWYNKAVACKDAIDDLKLTQRELRKEMSDNIVSQYDGFVARIEHSQTLLENYISRMELRGMSVSTKYYDALITTEQSALSKLKTERTKLLENLNTALKNGELAKGSEAWNEMQGKIDEVTESIQMCTNNIFEFQNEIRQIEWDNFDYLHDTISQITSETEFLISLLESQDMFSDNGTITNAGMSTMGLHGSNHNMFMEQSQSYAREIEELNRQIASSPNNKDLIGRRNELLGLQRDMILSAEAEKQAMIDLAREGYDLQLESLQELIDKYSETLDSQKELYDYQKKLKDQTKEIADLEKQLSAYQGDNSEETQAKIQQIKLDLEEARDNLEETEYDKYISDQKELLETMYTDYEEIINARFDNTDALFSDLIADVNANATTINSTLTSETDKVGYTLTDSLTSIWGDTGTVLSDFSNGFADFSGKFDTYTQNATTNIESLLGTINNNLVSMLNASDKLGTSEVTKALDDKTYTANATMVTSSSSSSSSKTTTTSSSKSSSSSSSSSKKSSTAGYISSLSSTINSGSSKSYIKRVQTALKALGFKGKNGKALSVDGIWGTNTDYAVKSFQKSSKYGGKITADGIIGKNTKAKFKKAGYKKGIYNLKQNELAWTQEDNIAEAIIRPSDGAILTPLVKGDSVLNGTATSNLWDMTNDPSKFIRENLSGDLDINNRNGSVLNNSVQNNIDMNITLPNVKNYTEFVNELQRDSKFERMIQDMTINQLSGKSSLNKFRHKFK